MKKIRLPYKKKIPFTLISIIRVICRAFSAGIAIRFCLRNGIFIHHIVSFRYVSRRFHRVRIFHLRGERVFFFVLKNILMAGEK